MTTPPVVVGVDDSADARSAVLWAAAEAALAQAPLLIVHSPRLPSSTRSGSLGVALRVCDDIGQAVLDSSMALARASQPGVLVRSLLSHADPAQALLDLSVEARLLVLGSRTAVAGEMSLLASKRVLVSAHAHCPVLLLGPVSTFSPPARVSRIVVGAADSRAGRAAVDFAAAEAVRRGLPLQVLRLERAAQADPAEPSRPARASSVLPDQVAGLRRGYPALDVTIQVITGEPAEILPFYTDGSTILVVGCHHSDDRWSTRLGPVATSVIHRGRGAVVVVGHAAHREEVPMPSGQPAPYYPPASRLPAAVPSDRGVM
jgi:nucleotide-binding universal stress UspA family protein